MFRNMSIPHPRSLGVTPGALLDSVAGHPRGWALSGWHCEVLPAGGRRLVRNPGVVVDPDLLWWQLSGPGAMWREPTPRRGGTASCQGGGRARPVLHAHFRSPGRQYLAASSGTLPEIFSGDGSYTLGVHLPRLSSRGSTSSLS